MGATSRAKVTSVPAGAAKTDTASAATTTTTSDTHAQTFPVIFTLLNSIGSSDVTTRDFALRALMNLPVIEPRPSVTRRSSTHTPSGQRPVAVADPLIRIRAVLVRACIVELPSWITVLFGKAGAASPEDAVGRPTD